MSSINYDQQKGYWVIKCTDEAAQLLMGLSLNWEGKNGDFERFAVAEGCRPQGENNKHAEVYITNRFVEWWANADADDREFVLEWHQMKFITEEQMMYLLTGNPEFLKEQ